MLYTEIITDNKLFLRLYNKGEKVFTPYVIIYYRSNGLPFNRLGLTAGKKVGNAVKRNHARRLIRAAYAENEIILPVGYDFVFVARGAISDVKSGVISSVIRKKLVPALKVKNNEKNTDGNDKVLS